MYTRHLTEKIIKSFSDTPVVFLNGARQTGKSTLAKWLIENKYMDAYYNLDDLNTLAAIKEAPQDFINNLTGRTVIDEIQKVPELLIAIKSAVDANRQPGRFLLTGSANIFHIPKISDSLAGRMEIFSLWPLSQGEIKNTKEKFIDNVFSQKLVLRQLDPLDTNQLYENILTGGYPEVIARTSNERKRAWFNSYITAILQKDIIETASIEHLVVMPRLLKLLGARSSSLLNTAELSRSLSLPLTTLRRYLSLLETTFLVNVALPWSNNMGKRLVKSPKIYLSDTGLMAYLLNIDRQRLLLQHEMIVQLLENFVVMELKKQLGWSQNQPRIFHFRSQSGQEVDIILEDAAGYCVGIEVKASSSVNAADFSGLKAFENLMGKRFLRGIILYTGKTSLPFGKNLCALPINALWEK